jgi:hypothetical protein
MNFGGERMQTHRKGFVLLVGNEIDFGVEQLANEGMSIIEAVHFLPSKLGQGCFGPVSNELDRIEEVFFLCPQLLKALLLGQVL